MGRPSKLIVKILDDDEIKARRHADHRRRYRSSDHREKYGRLFER